ncbi:uncharacterized protein LOC128961575 [Oppia nitens]|uniref:uncharacterized protein LOC128961575 n=1 Tax=Oppia nitens TaxID=1686743 RepID=UPI0023DB262F|nr:uncharacterized protein LOC128961575 [Oppia nitens]
MNVNLNCCVLLSVILLIQIDLLSGECCHVPLICKEGSKSVERCYDCTEATIYCGVGKCNIVGCNCDGGCRKGDSSLWCWNIAYGCTKKYLYQTLLSLTDESDVSLDVINVFNKMDTNADSKVSFNELKKYKDIIRTKGHRIAKEFKQMDKNNDKFLTIDEIDN